jgi:hypothetical protein
VAKCAAEYHRDKNITLRVSDGRNVNVHAEEGAAIQVLKIPKFVRMPPA